MPTEHIVALLIAERDRLSRAIEALQGPKRRGRPPKNPYAAMMAPVTVAPIAPTAPTKNARRGMSPAAKKAASARMKAYWAKKRKNATK